jgi:N-acetylneuraminate synthase
LAKQVEIGGRIIGRDHPVYVIAEIGINHNGDVDVAKQLIDMAKVAGCNAVKFQKRTPELCVPPAQRDVPRETPWGVISYLEYRHRVELGIDEYRVIDRYCRERNIAWFASPWDEPSVAFLEAFNPPCYKVPSAALTDTGLLACIRKANRPVILSTGMSTMDEIRAAVQQFDGLPIMLMHCTSTYPAKADELNLLVIQRLQSEFKCPVGYSGHEVGLQATYAAVALGASLVERHITLDRTMWGTDQAASVEPGGLLRLVRDIRIVERALGDGIKRIYDSEKSVMAKLRRASVIGNS